MIIAVDQHDQMIRAEECSKQSDHCYYCPGCGEKVFLKDGPQMITHFCHYAHCQCQHFSEGETPEHLKGKVMLYQHLKHMNHSVELEPYLTELQQRPDILLINQQCVIEFQCSPISVETIVSRTKGYQSAGYRVMWIVGDKLAPSGSLNAVHKAMLCQIRQQPVLIQLNTDNKHYHVYCPSRDCVQTRRYPLDYLFKMDDWVDEMKLRLSQQPTYDIKAEHRKLEQQSFYRQKHIMPLLQLLYEHQESLISVPKEIYMPLKSEWMLRMNQFEWKYRLIIWIESLPLHTVITSKLIKQWVKRLTDGCESVFYQTPTLHSNVIYWPVIEFLDQLSTVNILKKLNCQHYCVQATAKRFKWLSEKLK